MPYFGGIVKFGTSFAAVSASLYRRLCIMRSPVHRERVMYRREPFMRICPTHGAEIGTGNQD